MKSFDPAASIEGWLHPICSAAIQSALLVQKSNNIYGNSLEIGVYFGKTLAYLVCDQNEQEITFGIDPFKIQYPNKPGNEAIDFQQKTISNIKSLREKNHIKGKTILIKGFSNEEKVISQLDQYQGTFRVISIDGSHRHVDVISDLLWANRLANENALILVDDFCNSLNPEVTSAVKEFLCNTSEGREWHISFAITPFCSPRQASTRIFLSKTNSKLDYKELITQQLLNNQFETSEYSLEDYMIFYPDFFGSNCNLFIPK